MRSLTATKRLSAALVALSLLGACGHGASETKVKIEKRTTTTTTTTTIEPGPAAEIK